MKKEVIVIICCDTEPDQPEYGGMSYDTHRGKHTWRGVEEGIPKAKEIANLVRDSEGRNAKITWFLRSDDQMNELYGDYAWMVKNFLDLWRELEHEGDEIGWHSHLWRWDKNNTTWYPEVEDEIWIENCLKKGYTSFLDYFNPASVRMGWDFSNNFIMRKLNELGIMVDLSALPGQKSIGCKGKSPYSVCPDWEITSEHQYFPSKYDFRRDAVEDEESLNILEIPVTCFKVPLPWYIKRLFRRIYMPKKGFPVGKKNAVTTTIHSYFFKLGTKRLFIATKESNSTTFLVSFFHADELLIEKGISNFKENLEFIEKVSKMYGVPFRFLTASEAAKEIIGD